MTVVRGIEAAAWAVFLGGIVTMLVRGYVLRKRSVAQKYRTGYLLAVAVMASAPVFAVVYTLAGLGVAETFWGQSGGRRGPWAMAFIGAVLTAVMPGALRRTRAGMAEHGDD